MRARYGDQEGRTRQWKGALAKFDPSVGVAQDMCDLRTESVPIDLCDERGLRRQSRVQSHSHGQSAEALANSITGVSRGQGPPLGV